jgi:glycosyltransferase involved in cell wall biosynthesis
LSRAVAQRNVIEPQSDASIAESDLRIAVLIPCHNEEAAIRHVIRDFRASLPNADVYVYDNASTDHTARAATEAGALVRSEPLKGKGHVVRRMFSDVEADIYVLVDGDDTYNASSAPLLIRKLIAEHLDMVCGARTTDHEAAFRRGHRWGNRFLTSVVAAIFGSRFEDMLTGYRILSRRFVKSFPALSSGFEIETELTVHALELRMPVGEMLTVYKDRPKGSASKLRTYRDGIRILATIMYLVKEERPLKFFSAVFLALAGCSIILAIPIFITFVETGLVPKMPTAVLTTGMMVLAFLSLVCGLILDTVTLGRREMKRMRYLAIPGIGAADAYVDRTAFASRFHARSGLEV